MDQFNFADEFGPAKIIHIYEPAAGQHFFQEGFEIQDAENYSRKAERTAKNGRLGDVLSAFTLFAYKIPSASHLSTNSGNLLAAFSLNQVIPSGTKSSSGAMTIIGVRALTYSISPAG